MKKIKSFLSIIMSIVMICSSLAAMSVTASAAKTKVIDVGSKFTLYTWEVEAAIKWAESNLGNAQVQNAIGKTPDDIYDFPSYHECSQFVRSAFWGHTDTSYIATANASVWWKKWKYSTSQTEIPPRGALVFWLGEVSGLGDAGHVALSLGGGKAICAGGKKVEIVDTNKAYKNLTYAGWGTYKGLNLEVETAASDSNTGTASAGSIDVKSNLYNAAYGTGVYVGDRFFKVGEKITVRDSSCFRYGCDAFNTIFENPYDGNWRDWIQSKEYICKLYWRNSNDKEIGTEVAFYNNLSDGLTGGTTDYNDALSLAKPGDVIQAYIKSKSGVWINHTMIVYSTDTSKAKISILDSNRYGDDLIRLNSNGDYDYTFDSFASTYKRFRIYRATNYPKSTSSSIVDPLVYAFQEPGKYSTKYAVVGGTDQDATVYFTTDGSNPTTKSSSAKSYAIVTINKNMTIKAMYVKNKKKSNIISKTFTSKFMFGDADGDGKVTKADATAINDFQSGKLAYICICNADVNGDGKMDTKDASVITDKLGGRISSFPVEEKPTLSVTSSDKATAVVMKSNVSGAALYYSVDGGKTYKKGKSGASVTITESTKVKAYTEIYGQRSAVASKNVTIGQSSSSDNTVKDSSTSNGSIKLKHTSITLKRVGAQKVMIVTFNDPKTKDRTLKFKSSNSSVAKVDKDGIITAVSKGTCKITATASDGSSVSCTVTVK